MGGHQQAVDAKKQLSWTMFTGLVQPVLTDNLNWRLVLGERGRTTFEDALDYQSSVDALRVMPIGDHENGYLRGVAIRVQPQPKNYRTFTIGEGNEHGLASELLKLQHARLHLGVMPFYFLQAYVTPGSVLLGFAVAQATTLLDAIEGGWATSVPNRQKQYMFKAVAWDKIAGHGHPIIEWDGNTSTFKPDRDSDF